MTNRGRVLVIAGILGLWLAVLRNQASLACLSLAVLVWLFVQWIVFELRLWYCWPKIIVRRQINGRSSDAVSTLWTSRTVCVVLTIDAPAGSVAPVCVVRDCLPDNLVLDSGSSSHASFDGLNQIRFEYSCHCPSAGTTFFAGLHFQFRDASGLFLAERMHRESRVLRVLPAYGQASDMRPAIKRVNSVPQHGIHQLRRAGLGSELLELREYQPGDPPKSIAWKVSARRGKLMTRQYESEVPVRVTLLIDAGGNVRSGKLGSRPLDQLTAVAAGISNAAVSVGDAVGAILIDGTVQHRVRPGNGDRALYLVLEALAEFSCEVQSAPDNLTSEMRNYTIALLRERYADLLDSQLYRPPFSLFPLRPSKRKQQLQHRQIATVLAEIYQLSPSDFLDLATNERSLVKRLIPWLSSIGCGSSRSGRNLKHAEPGERFKLLANELARAVAYANDNELFVIIAELQGTDQELEPLLSAAKVALSRHHRVTVICTLPPQQELGSPSLMTVSDVVSQIARLEAALMAKSLRRTFRRIGAKFAFAHEASLVAAVMAEAELAGSGRFVARSAIR